MIKLTQEMIDWVQDAEAKNIQDPVMKFEIEFDLPSIRIAERFYDLALEIAGCDLTISDEDQEEAEYMVNQYCKHMAV